MTHSLICALISIGIVPLGLFVWFMIETCLNKIQIRKAFKKRTNFYENTSIKNYNLMDSSEQFNVLKVVVSQSITDDEAKSLFYIRNNKITFEQLFDLYNKNSIEIQKAKNTKRIEIETSGNQILPQNTFNSYIK